MDLTMYPPQNNGPHTTLAATINAGQTSITVANASVLPDAPNVLTIGMDEDAELVLMESKTGNILSVQRGFNGTAAKAWDAETWIYRAITAQDVKTLQTRVDNTITTMTAEAFEALTTAQKVELYASGVRVIAVEGGLDVDEMSDMQRFAAFAHPVGEIVELTIATNPATLWGFGTWESYMPGRVLVGAGTADSGTVYTAGQTGGEETHTLATSEMPAHTHAPTDKTPGTSTFNYYVFQITRGLNSESIARFGVAKGSDYNVIATNPNASDYGSLDDIATADATASTGDGQPHNIMQPYAAVYRWLRVA